MREHYRIIMGEAYEIERLPKEAIIFSENGAFGTKALVQHKKRVIYDSSLDVRTPTIEELMYFITKNQKR